MSPALVEEQDLGRQGLSEGSPRLRAWLEQRHGARKVPLCLGAGMAGIQDATAIVGGEKREVGGRFSHTGPCRVRERSEELMDWCAQLSLRPPCLGPATLCKTVTPPSLAVLFGFC